MSAAVSSRAAVLTATRAPSSDWLLAESRPRRRSPGARRARRGQHVRPGGPPRVPGSGGRSDYRCRPAAPGRPAAWRRWRYRLPGPDGIRHGAAPRWTRNPARTRREEAAAVQVARIVADAGGGFRADSPCSARGGSCPARRRARRPAEDRVPGPPCWSGRAGGLASGWCAAVDPVPDANARPTPPMMPPASAIAPHERVAHHDDDRQPERMPPTTNAPMQKHVFGPGAALAGHDGSRRAAARTVAQVTPSRDAVGRHVGSPPVGGGGRGRGGLVLRPVGSGRDGAAGAAAG